MHRNIALAQSMCEFLKENSEHNVWYNSLLPLAIERPNGTFPSNFYSMLFGGVEQLNIGSPFWRSKLVG